MIEKKLTAPNIYTIFKTCHLTDQIFQRLDDENDNDNDNQNNSVSSYCQLMEMISKQEFFLE